MGRRENVIPDPHSPQGRVAAYLRACRAKAGGLTYQELGQRTGYSAGVLSRAASGLELPTCAVVEAYVRGCTGNVEEVEEAVRVWRIAAVQARSERAPDPGQVHAPADLRRELALLAASAGMHRTAEIHTAMMKRGSTITRGTFYRWWKEPTTVMPDEVLAGILRACHVNTAEAHAEWRAARDRAESAHVPDSGSPDPDDATPAATLTTAPAQLPPAVAFTADRQTPPVHNLRPLGERQVQPARKPAASEFGTDSRREFMAEFKRLRKGRGIHQPDLDSIAGPRMRRLSGVDDDDDPGVVRDKVIDTIKKITEDLPDDLKLAVETALGMNPSAQSPFLTERIGWLAARQDRDNRTIIRRIDLAIDRMCEVAVKRVSQPQQRRRQQQPVPGEDWYVQKFEAILRLDGPTAVCHELRAIKANRDGVDRIQWSISLAPTADDTPADLDVEVLHGVSLSSKTKVSARRFVLDLQLPISLDAGQTHAFGLQVRIPHGQSMRPTYVFWPERRCEQFHLVVRFNPTHLPTKVWSVDRAFHRDVDDLEPGPTLLDVDGNSEVEVMFNELRADRGYGIQWVPDGDTAASIGAEPH